MLLLLLLHLYILRARSSLWSTFYEKKYHIHISRCLPLKNFPCCCSQHTFRLWCECMGVYIWETETFIWFLRRNGKSLPPWRASRVGGKIPNTQFRVIIFLSTTTTTTTTTTTLLLQKQSQWQRWKKQPSSVQIFTKCDFSVLWDWVGAW